MFVIYLPKIEQKKMHPPVTSGQGFQKVIEKIKFEVRNSSYPLDLEVWTINFWIQITLKIGK